MVFTSEEIWSHLSAAANKAPSVYITNLPNMDDILCDDSLARQLQKILNICAKVTKALEAARMQKVVGHSLDAAVTLDLGSNLYELLLTYVETD